MITRRLPLTVFPSVSSTMEAAKRLLSERKAQGGPQEPFGVLAETQSGGRGTDG